jgi:hypothetical protein
LEHTFKIEDQGELSDYLGIKIGRKVDGTLEWTQPTLIHSILKDLRLEVEGLKNQPKIRTIPASSTVALTDHQDSTDHNPGEFDYRQVIGKLLYLKKKQGQIYHVQYINVQETVPNQKCSIPLQLKGLEDTY